MTLDAAPISAADRPTLPAGSNNIGTDSGEQSTSALASDFETFLRLLTTQLQNQDPSKPLDSTEFVAQLASFSAVEQQIGTNKRLDELISQINNGVAHELSQWIGAKVRSTAATEFDGAPVEVSFEVPKSASSAELTIRNADGLEVNRIPVDVSDELYVWEGKNFNGSEAPSGNYRFELEAFEGGTSIGVIQAETFSKVKEARVIEGEVELVFGDGSKTLASNVGAVRG